MRALERRRRLQGYEEEGGAHHRFPRLRRVGDDVCASLAVPLGEVSSVYSLYARRAAALFAARDSDRCGRSYGELLSAASSRTRSTECGFAKAKPGKQAIAAARPGTRNELVRAGDECSFPEKAYVWRGAVVFGFWAGAISAKNALNSDLQLSRTRKKWCIYPSCSPA